MMDRVVVTGVGLVTAVGKGKDTHLRAFRQQTSGLRYARHLPSRHTSEMLIGEIDQSNEDLSADLGLPENDNGYTRTALLTIAGVGELLKDVGQVDLLPDDFAFVNANTVGGMSKMEEIYSSLISADTDPLFLKYVHTLDCAHSSEVAAAHFGLQPFLATISTACSSSASAIMMGARLLRNGVVSKAICGGADALSRFTVNGFNSLKNVAKGACTPFDQNRAGLNLGEAAGYCLLEWETDAKARGAHILAVLSGYANTNDAYHPTAPSPTGEGAIHTMTQALKMARVLPADIGYINAHGTATQNNDLAEGRAIQSLFGHSVPFSSTKPFTGHTLAAAGVIEGIFSMWAMEADVLLPNLHFGTRMDELSIEPIRQFADAKPIQHVLSNSFGFGGSNVSLIFSKP